VGSFTILNDQQTPIGQAHGNTFVHEVAAIQYTGGLSGVVAATDTIVVHADGSIEAFGSETCDSCTIGGRTGSFTAAFMLHGSTSGIMGTERFLSAAGGLAGLHGGGKFDAGPAGNTYSYRYRFTPSHRRDEGAGAAAARTAHTANSPANQVRAAERNLLRAVVAHDTQAAGALLAPDFQGIDVTGTAQTRADDLANIGGAIDFVKDEPISPIRVRMHGNSAVARVKLAFKVVAGGQTVKHDAWATDVFERRHRNWQVVWEQTTAIPNNLGLFIQSLLPKT
jgi:ketosteroid isomerase-like protein